MSPRDGSAVRVLFVGDDAALVESAVVEGEIAATVRAAPTTEAGSGVLDGDGVECVVCEYRLPSGTCLDLLETVRDRHPDTPVFVLVDDADEASEALAAGANDYLDRSIAAERPSLLARRLEGVVAANGDDDGPTEEWYESLLTHSSDAITVIDADGTVTYQSPSLEGMLGYDPDELVDDEALAYIHPEDRERVVDAFETLLDADGATAEEFQYRVKHADGSWVWVESVGRNLGDAPLGEVVVDSRTITERKEYERELERYRTLLELMPDTVVITDTDGIHTEVYGFDGWGGYERDDLVGEHISKVTTETDRKRGERVIRDLLADEDREKATYETHICTKDGEMVPFENHITLLPPDEDGRSPGTMSVLRDISDRRKRERRLERAQTIFQNVTDGVFLFDVTDDGRFEVQHVNPAYEAMTGLSIDEIRGRTPREFLGPALGPRIEAHLKECADGRRVLHYEETVDVPDVPSHWEIRLAPVTVDGSVVNVVGVIRDITDRKERERDLRLKTRAMDEAPIGITIAESTATGTPIDYVNEGFEALTGYDETDIQGRTFGFLRGQETDPDEFAVIERAIERERAASAELVLYRADGTPLWSRVSVAPVGDDDGASHFVAFLQDVTDRKEYETEIERRFDEFGEVFAGEIRKPLDEAQRELESVREDTESEELDEAAAWLQRLDDLVDDLATVHSNAVPSREHSELALRGSPEEE